jgi:hypothetical protein
VYNRNTDEIRAGGLTVSAIATIPTIATVAITSTGVRVANPLVVVTIAAGAAISSVMVVMVMMVVMAATTIARIRLAIVSVPPRDCLQITIAEFDLAASMF